MLFNKTIMVRVTADRLHNSQKCLISVVSVQ